MSNRYLEALRRVPKGETRSFMELAAMAGRPGAARAAGRAVRACPMDSRLPWHRVVAADGTLIGEEDRTTRQLTRLRREGARPRDGESVTTWGARCRIAFVGKLRDRVYVAATDERASRWIAMARRAVSRRGNRPGPRLPSARWRVAASDRRASATAPPGERKKQPTACSPSGQARLERCVRRARFARMVHRPGIAVRDRVRAHSRRIGTAGTLRPASRYACQGLRRRGLPLLEGASPGAARRAAGGALREVAPPNRAPTDARRVPASLSCGRSETALDDLDPVPDGRREPPTPGYLRQGLVSVPGARRAEPPPAEISKAAISC